MKLTKHSINKFYTSCKEYDIPKDYADPVFNYLVYGFEPGSFFTALIANDAHRAITSSHPANSIPALKKLVAWLLNCMPYASFGSYEKVDEWLKMSSEERRAHLEHKRLIHSEADEIVLILKDEPLKPVHFF
jgi:hypothetical protein